MAIQTRLVIMSLHWAELNATRCSKSGSRRRKKHIWPCLVMLRDPRHTAVHGSLGQEHVGRCFEDMAEWMVHPGIPVEMGFSLGSPVLRYVPLCCNSVSLGIYCLPAWWLWSVSLCKHMFRQPLQWRAETGTKQHHDSVLPFLGHVFNPL